MQENHSLSWDECHLQRGCLEWSTGLLHPHSAEHPSPFSSDTPAHSHLLHLDALGRSGHNICFALHIFVNTISLLLAALCWTPVFDSKSVVCDGIDAVIGLFIFWLNVAPPSQYIFCFLLSLCISLPSSLSTAWMSSSRSCEVIMVLVQKPSVLLLLWSVSPWLTTQIRSFHLSDYDYRNYNISKHNQLSIGQTDIQSTVIKCPKLCQ